MTPAWHSSVVAGVAVVLAGGLVACGGNAERNSAECDDLRWRAHDTGSGAVVLMIDTYDTSSAVAERVSGGLRSLTNDAVAGGVPIRLVVDPGAGTPLVVDPCLDGSRVVDTQRENQRRERADLAAAQDAVAARVYTLVRTAPVQRFGTPTRLLAQAADGTRPNTTIVLSSNLLGTSEDQQDCLDTDGVLAKPATADRMVGRCLESGQLSPITQGHLVITDPGASSRTAEQTRLAFLLANALCRRLAADCEVR